MPVVVRLAADEAVVDTMVVQLPPDFRSMIGRLIGKQGSNLDRLEKDSGARIRLDTDKGTATIHGSAQQIQIARAALLKQIEDVVEVTVELPPDSVSLMGFLIGKGGCHIKQIQTESKAIVRLDGTLGTAKLSGTQQQVQIAQRLLLQRLSVARGEAVDAGLERKAGLQWLSVARGEAVDAGLERKAGLQRLSVARGEAVDAGLERKAGLASAKGQRAKKILRDRAQKADAAPQTLEERTMFRAAAVSGRLGGRTEAICLM